MLVNLGGEQIYMFNLNPNLQPSNVQEFQTKQSGNEA